MTEDEYRKKGLAETSADRLRLAVIMAGTPLTSASLSPTERTELLDDLEAIDIALSTCEFGRAATLLRQLRDRQLDLADPIDIPTPSPRKQGA